MVDGKVAELLEGLAGKLGVAAEQLWGVLVRQAYVEGWLAVVSAAVGIAVSAAFAGIAVWWARKGNGVIGKVLGHPDEADRVVLIGLPIVVLGILAGGVAGATSGSVREAVTCFANPEYFALREVLGTLKKGGE